MLTTTISTIPNINSDNNVIFEVGSPLFYIVIGAGSSILANSVTDYPDDAYCHLLPGNH